MIRQIVCFIVAAAMFGFGLWILYNTVIVEGVSSLRGCAIGLFVCSIGGIWLWVDFGEPLFKRFRPK